MTCTGCARRTKDDLGPCPGCGSIGVPFLEGYFNLPPGPEPFHTVPWIPEAEGEEITGRTIRALRMSADLALAAGWSAATLRARRLWSEPSLPGSLVRTAVRWGMIP